MLQVTKGGKVETLHALVVVGNQDGVIGVGEHRYGGWGEGQVLCCAVLKPHSQHPHTP
jgi:hypothetical protein